MKIDQVLNNVTGVFQAAREGRQTLEWAEESILGKIVEFAASKDWEYERLKEGADRLVEALNVTPHLTKTIAIKFYQEMSKKK